MRVTHRIHDRKNRDYHKNESTGKVFFKADNGRWYESVLTRLALFDSIATRVNTFKGNK